MFVSVDAIARQFPKCNGWRFYDPLCLSVGWSICPLVHQSVHQTFSAFMGGFCITVPALTYDWPFGAAALEGQMTYDSTRGNFLNEFLLFIFFIFNSFNLGP